MRPIARGQAAFLRERCVSALASAKRTGRLHGRPRRPEPRVNLIRFRGVFAPNSRYRVRVTRAKRGRGGRHGPTEEPEEPTPAERRAAMTWAQRLKRVFGIDVETCPACGGTVRIIGCIEDRVVRLRTALNPPSMAQRFGFR